MSIHGTDSRHRGGRPLYPGLMVRGSFGRLLYLSTSLCLSLSLSLSLPLYFSVRCCFSVCLPLFLLPSLPSSLPPFFPSFHSSLYPTSTSTSIVVLQSTGFLKILLPLQVRQEVINTDYTSSKRTVLVSREQKATTTSAYEALVAYRQSGGQPLVSQGNVRATNYDLSLIDASFQSRSPSPAKVGGLAQLSVRTAYLFFKCAPMFFAVNERESSGSKPLASKHARKLCAWGH